MYHLHSARSDLGARAVRVWLQLHPREDVVVHEEAGFDELSAVSPTLQCPDKRVVCGAVAVLATLDADVDAVECSSAVARVAPLTTSLHELAYAVLCGPVAAASCPTHHVAAAVRGLKRLSGDLSPSGWLCGDKMSAADVIVACELLHLSLVRNLPMPVPAIVRAFADDVDRECKGLLREMVPECAASDNATTPLLCSSHVLLRFPGDAEGANQLVDTVACGRATAEATVEVGMRPWRALFETNSTSRLLMLMEPSCREVRRLDMPGDVAYMAMELHLTGAHVKREARFDLVVTARHLTARDGTLVVWLSSTNHEKVPSHVRLALKHGCGFVVRPLASSKNVHVSLHWSVETAVQLPKWTWNELNRKAEVYLDRMVAATQETN